MPYCDYFKEIPSDANLQRKIDILKDNANIARMLRSEIISSKTSSVSLEYIVPEPQKASEPNKVTTKDFVNKQLQGVFHNLSLLSFKGLSEDEISAMIRKLCEFYELSSIEIDKLKLMLYQDYLLYSKMYLASKSPLEQREIAEHIKDVMTKISLLDEQNQEEELTAEEIAEIQTTTRNNLFFLLSDSGNNNIFESIRKRKIPIDSYYKVRDLLLGMEVGSFKQLKRLKNPRFLQVRNDDIRIHFCQLRNGAYLIIDVFVKDFISSNYYQDYLFSKWSQYTREKQFYLTHCQDDEFIKKHANYLTELLQLLDGKTLDRGENNAKRSC